MKVYDENYILSTMINKKTPTFVRVKDYCIFFTVQQHCGIVYAMPGTDY